tara:strand:+ start:827 stop:1459 length:633 start_codon:yes stop_codon:yes gene_type:complete
MTATITKSKTNLYIISQIEENPLPQIFFKVGTGKDLKIRLWNMQVANPQKLKIEFTYEIANKDGIVLEKFIHKTFKKEIEHIHGEWFKGELKSCLERVKDLIKEFNSSPAKYRRLAKKEKWGSGGGNVPYGKDAKEIELINRLQELRWNYGRRMLSWEKVAEQLYQEGFKTRKGTRMSKQQAWLIYEDFAPQAKKQGKTKKRSHKGLIYI